MGVKHYNPTTPGLRGKVSNDFAQVSDTNIIKKLTKGRKRGSGRDNQGQISVRRKGGGHKRKYREIDFQRVIEMDAKVASIQYDPNRSAFIALLHYVNGEKSYVLATNSMKIGDTIKTGSGVKSAEGNTLPLSEINVGAFIHNIELNAGKGGQLVRSAGSYAKLLGRDGEYVSVQLPSGEVRLIHGKCRATVGELSNKDHKNVRSGKAGRSRWLGHRPKVRGVVMNPVDHPMGGGEGRSSGGRQPCSPTGQITKGLKTRKGKKYSDKYIVRKRGVSKRA